MTKRSLTWVINLIFTMVARVMSHSLDSRKRIVRQLNVSRFGPRIAGAGVRRTVAAFVFLPR